jgi:hypothetical protein
LRATATSRQVIEPPRLLRKVDCLSPATATGLARLRSHSTSNSAERLDLDMSHAVPGFELPDHLRRVQATECLGERVVATGGKGELYHREIEAIELYDPDLTLKGLEICWRRSRPHA